MITVLIVALSVMAVGVGVSLYVAAKAPVGFEDEKGFHYGPEAPSSVREVHGAVPALSR